MENIVILGSTGSIGRQVLEVLRKKPGNFKVIGLSGKDEIDILSAQIKEFEPKEVCVASKIATAKLQKSYPNLKME